MTLPPPPFPNSTLPYADQWMVYVFAFVAKRGRAGAGFGDVERHCAKSNSWARETLATMWKRGYVWRRVARELPGAPVRFCVPVWLMTDDSEGE